MTNNQCAGCNNFYLAVESMISRPTEVRIIHTDDGENYEVEASGVDTANERALSQACKSAGECLGILMLQGRMERRSDLFT